MERDICNEKAGIENLSNSQPQGISATSSNSVESETIIVIREETKFESIEDENSKLKSNTLGTSKVFGDEQKVDSIPPDIHASIIDIRGTCDTLSGELVNAETVCRICHLTSEHPSRTSTLIQLGCGCKNELGISHRQCAETWFRSKGNRLCEICNESAKNVTGIEEATGVMVGWNEMSVIASARNSSSSDGSCWRKNHFCDFLLACLVLAFILPWFFSRG
ncbi:E3 ubiquitin-protein ligase MARCH8-like [Fagus crenata]